MQELENVDHQSDFFDFLHRLKAVNPIRHRFNRAFHSFVKFFISRNFQGYQGIGHEEDLLTPNEVSHPDYQSDVNIESNIKSFFVQLQGRIHLARLVDLHDGPVTQHIGCRCLDIDDDDQV